MNQNKKTASLFICDLLKAEKKGYAFIFRHQNFTTVYLCATVTAKSFTNQGDKVILTVEDGTAAINCMMESNNLQDFMKRNRKQLEVCKRNASKNPLAQATLLTSVSCERLLKRCDINQIVVGDTVKLIGKLREFQDTNYIFISKIEKMSGLRFLEHRINYMKTIFQMYNEVPSAV